MGSAGIKRRKKSRPDDAEPSAPISEGDVGRLFGRFTWNAYSPAGSLERNGFLWRQLRRRGQRDGWTYVAYVVFAVFALPLVVFVVATIVNFATRLL